MWHPSGARGAKSCDIRTCRVPLRNYFADSPFKLAKRAPRSRKRFHRKRVISSMAVGEGLDSGAPADCSGCSGSFCKRLTPRCGDTRCIKPPNRSRLLTESKKAVNWCDHLLAGGRNEPTATVRALAVVVLDVGLQHRAKMPLAQDEHPVEALGADRPDESFGIGVGLRGAATACGGSRSPRPGRPRRRLARTACPGHGPGSLMGLSRSSRASERFRAIWAHQAALAAPSVTPPMRTFLVCHVDEEQDMERL